MGRQLRTGVPGPGSQLICVASPGLMHCCHLPEGHTSFFAGLFTIPVALAGWMSFTIIIDVVIVWACKFSSQDGNLIEGNPAIACATSPLYF